MGRKLQDTFNYSKNSNQEAYKIRTAGNYSEERSNERACNRQDITIAHMTWKKNAHKLENLSRPLGRQ
jgi:hypothetical protein